MIMFSKILLPLFSCYILIHVVEALDKPKINYQKLLRTKKHALRTTSKSTWNIKNTLSPCSLKLRTDEKIANICLTYLLTSRGRTLFWLLFANYLVPPALSDLLSHYLCTLAVVFEVVVSPRKDSSREYVYLMFGGPWQHVLPDLILLIGPNSQKLVE